MKLKQLLVLLAAPVAVSTNAFDDNLAWQYDDDYDDDNGNDDDRHEDLSSGPPLGFIQEALSQDRVEGYVSNTFNGTTTVLESYGGEEHSRRLFVCGGICIGVIVIAFAAATQAFTNYHVSHMPIEDHSEMSLQMALDSFSSPIKQDFLFKVENQHGELQDPKEYLEVDTVSGSGACGMTTSDGTSMVKVLCADSTTGKIEFTVKAKKTIDFQWNVVIMPMSGRRRDLSQKTETNGDIIEPPTTNGYYGTYWEKTPGIRIMKRKDVCIIVANKLPDHHFNDQVKNLIASIVKQAFESYAKAHIPAIIQSLMDADWGSLPNRRRLQSSEQHGFGITSIHTGVGDALYVRIYPYTANINLAFTKHGGEGTWHHFHSRYIMKTIPQGSVHGPTQTAIVSVDQPGWIRVVLDHDGDGQGLAGTTGIVPYNGGMIWCHNPEYRQDDECGWKVLDSGVVDAWIYVY